MSIRDFKYSKLIEEIEGVQRRLEILQQLVKIDSKATQEEDFNLSASTKALIGEVYTKIHSILWKHAI
jgi:hypothetical protein